MLEQKRLCGDGLCTTWAEEFRDGNKQVNAKNEEFAHEVNGTTITIACKTARHGRIPSYYEFAMDSTGAALPEVVSGQVYFMIDGTPPFLSYVKTGRLRALAAANPKRLAQLPDVPTFAELGVSGMEAGLWYGMLAPKGTPRAVIERLSAAINKALHQPDVRGRFAASSVETIGGTPNEFGRYIASEIKRWGEVARAANIHVD